MSRVEQTKKMPEEKKKKSIRQNTITKKFQNLALTTFFLWREPPLLMIEETGKRAQNSSGTIGQGGKKAAENTEFTDRRTSAAEPPSGRQTSLRIAETHRKPSLEVLQLDILQNKFFYGIRIWFQVRF